MNLSDFVIDLSDYQVIKESIGEGSIGTVSIIEETTTNMQYSAKICHNRCSSASCQRQFLSEVEMMKRVEYPSILRFIGFNMTNFAKKMYPTIITEYMYNGSLSQMLNNERLGKSGPYWSITTKQNVIFGLTAGMNFLHKKHILHHNLKPSNILLDKDYYPKICDFSMSKIINKSNSEILNQENSKSVIQSIEPYSIFIPPEIFIGKKWNYKIDVYAYAYILYEILSGTIPKIDAATPYIAMQKIEAGERPDTSIISNEAYQSLITECWRTNPDERPTFSEIIKRFQSDKSYLIDAYELSSKDNGDTIDIFKVSDYFHSLGYELLYVENHKPKTEDIVNYARLSKDHQSLIQRALDGNAEDCFIVAEMLEKWNTSPDVQIHSNDTEKSNSNEKIKPDIMEAIKYYKYAASLGSTEAMLKYANILYDGRYYPHVNKNKIEAAKYYKMAADAGNVIGMNFYGVILDEGRGVPQNKKEALRYYKMGVTKGNMDSMVNYALLLQKEEILIPNENTQSINNHGHNHNESDNDNDSVSDNDNENEENIDTEIQTKDAKYFIDNETRNQCLIEAARYMKIAADAGNSNGMYNYARMLHQGEGVSKDLEESARYAKLAADSGNQFAMLSFGHLLEKGEGVHKNIEEAVRYFKMAADKGNEKGMLKYSRMLQTGIGSQKNLIESTKYLKMCALKGNAEGMFQYGLSLKEGEGIEKNLDESISFFYQASLQGHIEAKQEYEKLTKNITCVIS
ncbi:hypothetical protein TRFO_15352 [Tritrichomonas foetus]|uniref:Protein kinase domain-containing protein n=1 Tax=Tritrichomonas foetus TaxID=1144522 RepID=A0A1J4KSP5_9EUKA|nr:hypothetical protein TRFO_15352 [Tritrichomonas foetus]|eukprot:OHT14311.1 hypothetical protein TRFO_15352 [Tritrichomonas foetus]